MIVPQSQWVIKERDMIKNDNCTENKRLYDPAPRYFICSNFTGSHMDYYLLFLQNEEYKYFADKPME